MGRSIKAGPKDNRASLWAVHIYAIKDERGKRKVVMGNNEDTHSRIR